MGHCLNLWHTHETKFGNELNNDCSISGDLLCDTPPDPNLRNLVDENCNYDNTFPNYSPDTRNIMSYSLASCLEHFSNGQVLRMRDALMNSAILQSVLNCGCQAFLFLENQPLIVQRLLLIQYYVLLLVLYFLQNLRKLVALPIVLLFLPLTNGTKLLGDNEIQSAALLDASGFKLKSYYTNRMNVEGIRKGIYILYAQVDGKIITKKIFIE